MAPPRRDAGQKASLRKAQKRLKDAKARKKKTARPHSTPKKRPAEKKWKACVDCKLQDPEVVIQSDGKPRCEACAKKRPAKTLAEDIKDRGLDAEDERAAQQLAADPRFRQAVDGLANAGVTSVSSGGKTVDIKPRARQRKLDPDHGVGEPITSDDVEVEPIEKTGAKLSFGFYALTLTDDQADEIRGLDPVTRAIEVATKMRARKDGSGRAPNGADWERALEKLTDKITGGW